MATTVHIPLYTTAIGGKIEEIEFDVFVKGSDTAVATAKATAANGYVVNATGLTAGVVYLFKMKSADGVVLAPSLQKTPFIGALEFEAYVPQSGHAVATVEDTATTPFTARGFVAGETVVTFPDGKELKQHGTPSVNAGTGAIIYTPEDGFTGKDQFLYIVSKDGTPIGQHLVVITVNAE